VAMAPAARVLILLTVLAVAAVTPLSSVVSPIVAISIVPAATRMPAAKILRHRIVLAAAAMSPRRQCL